MNTISLRRSSRKDASKVDDPSTQEVIMALEELSMTAALVGDGVMDEAAMQITQVIIKVFGGLCQSPLLREHYSVAQADLELLDEAVATLTSAERLLIDQDGCGSVECLRTYRLVSDALLPIASFIDKRSLWGEAVKSEYAAPFRRRHGGAVGRVEEALHEVTGQRPVFFLHDYLRLRGAL